MRTKEEHIKQCGYIERPGISASERCHYSKVYGVNRSSILLQLPHTQQLPQDIMHVLLEGIFPLHVEQLFDYIINVASLLSLDQINSRLLAFPYAYFNEKPSPIHRLCIKGTQSGKKFNISIIIVIVVIIATQMWELVNVLPVVIGNDMPSNDHHYGCFMLLNDMSSIIFSRVIARDQISLLRLMIKEYLEQFTALYPHCPLTPKLHYLVHIPTLIER